GMWWHYSWLRQHSAVLETNALELEAALQRAAQHAEHANNESARAEERERFARQQAYLSQIGRAWGLWNNGQGAELCELLNHQRPERGQADLRGFEWYYLWALGENVSQTRGHFGSV